MDERVVQFRVGVMVLAALIVTGILALLFGELPSVLRGGYPVYVRFTSAPGVSEDTPVRKNGQPIGRVTKVEFTRDNQVVVTARINGNVELFTDEAVRIKTGILGDAEVDFVPGQKQPAQRIPVQSGNLLQGSVSVDPLSALTELQEPLNRAANELASAGSEVSKLAKTINDTLGSNKENVSKILDETEGSLRIFQKSMTDVDDIIGDVNVRNNLKQAAGELPRLLRDTRDAMQGMQQTVALANNTLRNMEPFSKALDEQGEGIITNMSSSVQRLDELLGQMNRFSRGLNSREGSLGQLINNPELYNNLSQAAANVNKLTRQLEPIVHDARVITDKVARHPGVIITDAVSPGPGIK